MRVKYIKIKEDETIIGGYNHFGWHYNHEYGNWYFDDVMPKVLFFFR